ncbi:MAG: endopeptidase La [Deltaproteobacteria bacterium]|nr:endopeptidase La [Deltaproteobacteria bacterium]
MSVTLPLLPLRAGALFPATSLTLPVGRARSLLLVRNLSRGDEILVGLQKSPDVMEPGRSDLHDVATRARVHRVVQTTDRGVRLILRGLSRVRLGDFVAEQPYLTALATPLPDVGADADTIPNSTAALKDALPALAPFVVGGFDRFLNDLERATPGELADRVAAALPLSSEQQAELLRTSEVPARLLRTAQFLDEVIAKGEIKKTIESEVRRGLGESQRKALLREQMRAIQKELGESGDGAAEAGSMRERVEALGELPEDVAETVERELARLESLNPQQAEYNVVRNYLDLIASLPWNERVADDVDLDAVEAKLNADHDGLDEPKKRILEHLAVLQMGGAAKATILCLAGPPGVGKTSLGQSVADATGRPFVRIALGGVRDEATIRGHRRTYVGALPGRILDALKKAKVRNPVILLDEIDKLGQGWMGSPEAALLEVLDPEQNSTFTDHYLELPFDLSEVVFLTTANDLGGISGPLRDRLEIIELQGYTVEEKARIARNHLIPRELGDHAITEDLLHIEDDALVSLIGGWTREAGVRQLKREIRKVTRALALRLARTPDARPEPLHVEVDGLPELLGRRRFYNDVAERTAFPGVATGLAWTPVGGDILFIETSRMPGKGSIQITGQLGDVMQESARAALTYVRSHADELGVDPTFLESSDLHIHVPAGAVPKDGPSAGVTMFTALTSLLTGRRIKPDVAMTGEVTLRGRVLPVGGIKSKVIAAHRAGLRTIVLPHRNERDVAEIPASITDDLTFVFATDMGQVLAAALEETPSLGVTQDAAPVAPANEGPTAA